MLQLQGHIWLFPPPYGILMKEFTHMLMCSGPVLFFLTQKKIIKSITIFSCFYEKNASVKILLNISVYVPDNKETYTGLEIR